MQNHLAPPNLWGNSFVPEFPHAEIGALGSYSLAFHRLLSQVHCSG
jgi:hypothetical protein